MKTREELTAMFNKLGEEAEAIAEEMDAIEARDELWFRNDEWDGLMAQRRNISLIRRTLLWIEGNNEDLTFEY